MNCPSCKAPMEGAAHFCGVCGHKLESRPDTSDASIAFTAHKDKAPLPGASRPPASGVAAAQAVARKAPADPYIGITLNGRFTIEDKLGEGGFGAVYRGVQNATGRKVAIKLLHPEMTRDKNVLERFRREGQVLCSLRDAHTITTYDFDQTQDGTLFIAMELLEGKSLHSIFQDEAPIAWQRMLKIMEEMCSSLEEAHGLGIVHRDLKPENIYLESRPGNPEYVKILDFGIAKVMRGDGIAGNMAPQLTATGQTLGTLEYMSPEQLMGKPLDGRSDIYGLGVVAFEMMTGRLPFPDAIGPAALIAAQLKKVPPKVSDAYPRGGIPREVDALVLRMLEKDKAHRFADAGDLRREIDTILQSIAGVGRPSFPYAAGINTPAPGTLTPQTAPGAQPIEIADQRSGPYAQGPVDSSARGGGPVAFGATPVPGSLAPPSGMPQSMPHSSQPGMPSSTESMVRMTTRSSSKTLWIVLLLLLVIAGSAAVVLLR